MNTTQSSVLGSLRALIPRTRCRFGQSLTVAERQAATLTRYLTSSPGQPSTPADERVAALPHIRVVREPLPVPSFSRWNGHDWIICLNCRQPAPRSRLALLHEFKHIIDYGHTRRLQPGTAAGPPTRLASRHPPSGRVGQALPGAHRHRPDPPRPEPSGRSR